MTWRGEPTAVEKTLERLGRGVMLVALFLLIMWMTMWMWEWWQGMGVADGL